MYVAVGEIPVFLFYVVLYVDFARPTTRIVFHMNVKAGPKRFEAKNKT